MIRVRLVVALAVAAAVTVGGLAMERTLGIRAAPAAGVPPEVSGAWFCPHGGGEGWRPWVVVANPFQRAAEVILTTSSRGRPTTSRATVEPGTQRAFDVQGSALASATTVEYFGAPVVAGMGLRRPRDNGTAAEPCADAADERWYVAEGTAVEGQAPHLVVTNPTATDVAFDVTLTTEEESLRPGRLRGVVLPPRATRAFDLNRFVLGARSVAATVAATIGQVAVAGLSVSESGVRSTLGVRETSSSWLLPGAGDGGQSSVEVLAGDAEVPLEARTQAAEAQVAALDQEAVAPRSVATFQVDSEEGGMIVEATGGASFVASRRMSYREEAIGAPHRTADQAATAGVTAADVAWVVPPAVGPEGGRSVLLLQNPAETDAQVEMRLLGPDGPLEGPGTLMVPAGRTVRVGLREFTDEAQVTAVIEATAGAVVPAQVALDRTRYAVVVGVPLPAY